MEKYMRRQWESVFDRLGGYKREWSLGYNQIDSRLGQYLGRDRNWRPHHWVAIRPEGIESLRRVYSENGKRAYQHEKVRHEQVASEHESLPNDERIIEAIVFVGFVPCRVPDECHTPVLKSRTEASICVLRMFKSHA
jgi:hypothetical protein